MTRTLEYPAQADPTALNGRTVLLVDSDPTEADRVRAQLATYGANTIVCPDGAEALMSVGSSPPDVILLGRDVPVINGLTFLSVLRRRHLMPVIAAVDREGAHDAALLLGSGATACVTWPADVREVLAILSAISCLGAGPGDAADGGEVLVAGDLRVDVAGHDVYLGDERVRLPLREFQLLELLARNVDQTLPRSLINDALWGSAGGRPTNTLAVHIRRLRHRLHDNPIDPQRILTVRGVGYRLTAAMARPARRGRAVS